MRNLQIVNGVARGVTVAASIYEQTVTVGPGGISTGTPVTLPSAETYDSTELTVRLNGQLLENVIDYQYEGTVPRTQVSFTFDLVEGDRIVFRKEQG